MLECCFRTLEVILVSDFFLSHFNQCFIRWAGGQSHNTVSITTSIEDRRESRYPRRIEPPSSSPYRQLLLSQATRPGRWASVPQSKVAEGGVRPVRLLRKHFIRRRRKTKQLEVEKEQVSNAQTIFQRNAGVGFSEGLRLLKRPLSFPARQSVS